MHCPCVRGAYTGKVPNFPVNPARKKIKQPSEEF